MVRLCNLTDSSPIFLACVNHVTVLILFHVIVKYLLVAVKIVKKEKRILENFVTLGHDNLNTSVTNSCCARSCMWRISSHAMLLVLGASVSLSESPSISRASATYAWSCTFTFKFAWKLYKFNRGSKKIQWVREKRQLSLQKRKKKKKKTRETLNVKTSRQWRNFTCYSNVTEIIPGITRGIR